MRSDFNKLLTESPRLLNNWKFSDVRNSKGNAQFDEDAKGGKVSIHSQRRNTTVPRRSFNENLNTLRRFIQANVGRPWDKVYSEICANFDKRKVINDHILIHLFQYVETKAKLVDGRVCVLNSWRHSGRVYDYKTHTWNDGPEGYYDARWIPIKDDSCDWYVHPVDGLLKVNKGHKTRRQAKKVQQAEYRKTVAKTFRQINELQELHFEDGAWYIFTLKPVPPPKIVFGIPGYSDREFSSLPKEEQEKRGRNYDVRPELQHFYPTRLQNSDRNLYYAKRELASKKILKAHGLLGSAALIENQGKK